MKIAVVKVRGNINTPTKVRDTLKMLHLLKVNHCTIIDDRPVYKGMLQKAKDWITWGEIDSELVEKLLRKKGRLSGNKKLTDSYMEKNTKYKTIANFVKAFMDEKASLKDIPGIKLYFRLSPPKGGYENTKRQYANKGSLGNRGAGMGKLLERMIR
ncbi:MAG: 50S ribosomal protein L30 [Candidatus Diapherotrites archaeon]|nr:50S ribosomal protein L30 [Candidatus Diapherotrites archaeon]